MKLIWPNSLFKKIKSSYTNKLKGGEFRYTQDKYLIPSLTLEEIITRLSLFMDPSYPDSRTYYTLIESIYFDGPDYEFFQDHFEKIESGFKMRARIYGPNGKWNRDRVLLEIKEKKSSVSFKVKLTLNQFYYNQLIQGKKLTLERELELLNAGLGIKDLKQRIKKVNDLIQQYQLRPKLSVSYKRRAFESNNNVRVVIDNDLSFCPLARIEKNKAECLKAKKLWHQACKLNTKYQQGKNAIIEIKYDKELPLWTQKLLNDYQLNKTNFSKYCWSVAAILRKGCENADRPIVMQSQSLECTTSVLNI